jgi:23S rRNA (pseudouridine1915-N3)-methyltransferase
MVLTIICLLYRYRCVAFRMSNPTQTRGPALCSVRLRRAAISMGLEVKIRTVGRKNGGEPWLESAYTTYNTRLKSTNLCVTTQYHKNDEELLKGIVADENKNHKVVLLDPTGKMCTSEVFADDMYRWLEQGGSRLTFVIGGAEGLPKEVKEGNEKRDVLSLGMMTFTHQFARVLLTEQVYRASEIKKGSNYHK